MLETGSPSQPLPPGSRGTPAEPAAAAIVRILAVTGATVVLSLHDKIPDWSAIISLLGIALPADAGKVIELARQVLELGRLLKKRSPDE